MKLDRRTVLTQAALAAVAAGAKASPSAAQAGPSPAPAAPPPITRMLAGFVTRTRPEDIPAAVRKQGTRTLLNWVGCAVGGSRHPTVDNAVAALGPFAGRPEANVLGRKERFDAVTATLLNGISSHIFDYDDTHLKTIIHPAGPVASALLALSQHRRVTGAEFLHALILGVETECRIGNAVYPSHYDMGWHITGSCGPFGAAAACGTILGLSEQQMTWALGLAASQPVGLKVQFGSMTKSFHPGRAAQGGLTAALLAAHNYTADEGAIEGKDGWVQALSTAHNWAEITQGWGVRWEAALNTYKPFACGIVTHPGIDAAIQLRNENHLTADQIEAVELHANPLVQTLTGKTDPQTGLEGKFSIYHCIAVGLIYGAAGERQFQDAVVRDPAVAALRKKVSVRLDPKVETRQSDLTVRLKDGRVLTRHVENAVGSLERPMTDAQLEAKFADLAQGVIDPAKARRAMDLCWRLESLPDAGEIARTAAA